MEKISLDDLKKLCTPEIDALVNKIEAIALEKGIEILDDFLDDLLDKYLGEIHAKKFVTNKLRKIILWFKRKF